MRFISSSEKHRRSGVVLLVVMAMLSLFAVVGLSFVFYADSAATAMQYVQQANAPDQPDINPEALAAYFLSQFLYDTENNSSAMRGWSLARSIYGYNPAALNYIPYNGVGRSSLDPNPITFTAPGNTTTVDSSKIINYQKFSAPFPGDPLIGTDRTPEFFGKVGDANYRYVGGANPPWTAYDSNSLFLAQMRADGTVTMSSFERPWLTQGGPASKYTSLFPDPLWNQSFYPLPDQDASGHVKNADTSLSPNGNNDSKWMDLGYPVMTAPNGKRYKPLFAPLVVDLSNRLHLWAHGNRKGGTATSPAHVSNQGFAPTEVNLSKLPGTPIATATEGAGGNITVTTAAPHGLSANQSVVISNASVTGYNGVYVITSAPTATTFVYNTTARGLAASTGGTVLSNSELQALFNFKYGGAAGTSASVPIGTVPNFKPGAWFSLVDADALDPATTLSSRPPMMWFQTNTTQAVPSAGAHTVKVQNITNALPTPVGAPALPWAIQVGMTLVVDDGTLNNAEQVTVTTVNYRTNPPTFKATFARKHATGATVSYGSPNFGFPSYPTSWANTTGELANHPAALNLFAAGSPNMPPLPMYHQEALMRSGGTNSPALTSELLRRLPTILGNPRARNMVTLTNWHFDRVTASPFLTFNRTAAPGQYTYKPQGYPTITAPNAPNYSLATSVTTSGTTPPWNSEFGPDWRSTLSNYLRIDLTRSLTDYAVSQPQADQDRRQFAQDIYNALVRVTGARDPNVPSVAAGMTPPTSLDYQAARWLAQIAVNMVDYIDNDNYMTAFNWYPGGGADGWVFGTELPELVLSEIYAQQEPTKINVWAELYNPLKTGSVTLQNGNTPVQKPPYTIEIYYSTSSLTTGMRDPNNPGINQGAVPTTSIPLVTQTNWGNKTAAAQTTAITTAVLPTTPAGAPSGGTIVTKQIAPFATTAQTGAKETGSNVTVRTTTAHGLTAADVGKAVTITGVTDMTGAAVLGYDGSFLITQVPNTTTFHYKALTSGMAHGGGGTATYVLNGNAGYYVIGPVGAQYAAANRVPNLPATYLSSGMSAATPPISATIALAPTGATLTGTTVTIQTTGPLPATFVVGSQVTISGVALAAYNGGPFTITGVTANSFTYTVPATVASTLTAGSGGTATAPATATVPLKIALLLHRLANPTLVFNATSNPYITVDYRGEIPVNNGIGIAYGRTQPYDATQFLPQVSLVAAPVNQPQSTFFSKNTTPVTSYPWLVHLDRPPVNPVEMLHVSCYKPHELTQLPGFQQLSPWKDPTTLLYRVLDQMSTRYMAGTFTGGRFPGNINLNTITEPEIFQALCDSHDDVTSQYPYPWFKGTDVTAIFGKVLASRHNNGSTFPPTSDGVPFKSFSAGQITDTFLRPDPTTNLPIFVPPSLAPTMHPYVQASVLQKIYNNVTTTSNTFAVWWTVGYFEVVDESVRPARLGQEIGRSENRQIRHRFFAIVDRSAMQLHSTTSTAAVSVTSATPQTLTMSYDVTTVKTISGASSAWNSTQQYVVSNSAIDNNAAYICIKPNSNQKPSTNPTYWQAILQPGMILEIHDPVVGNSEAVAVQTVNGTSFTATFTKSHAAGVRIVCRGNPGPQATYNPNDDNTVVRHFSIIK